MVIRVWMHTMVRSVLAPLGVISLIASATSTVARADVPTPSVTRVNGDTPGSPGRNYPFFATDVVLKNYGYVEEEFFYEGQANTYTTPEFGKNADVNASGIHYRSRLLVRRPAQASRFNGTVIVEWLNVTNGYDTDVLWLYQKEFFVREGYAWVGVSVQDGGVSRPPNGIKVWSPARYGTLDLTGGGTVTDASLNFDIFTQAGAAVKRVPAVLGGLKPTLVIAAGQSQSAGRLGPYLNGVHARDPIYDAAFLTVSNQAMRTDLTIPVIKVLSETERATSRSQPDSSRVRVWTVAGATHSEQYSLLSRAAFLMRDLNLPAVDACETPARSRVEIRYVYNAAVDWLARWVRKGDEPPHAPPLEFEETAEPESSGRGRGGAGVAEKPVRRDEFGNARGGIRLPEMAVPVAKESAELCGLGGTHVPFEAATLNRLYPSHADFVSKVTDASRALVKAGFLLPADAAQEIDAAKRSIYGMHLTCGLLCSDARQFPSHPSSMLLAKQTAFLMIKGGDALVKLADDATRLIAQGYTLGPGAGAEQRFASAATTLNAYIDRVKQLRMQGNMPPETEALLAGQAATLRDLVRILAK
jgi:hypothetical protein